jgi:DNA-binding Lrp family transcriptional regulator
MRQLDEQEQRIIRALVRNPRCSDNKVSALTGVPVRTVSRKRAKLEKEGILSYYTSVEMQSSGTGRFHTQHMAFIKFRIGVTRTQIVQEIHSEPNVTNLFAQLIRESYIAETDGHITLVMVVEGQSDIDVIENLQGKIIPSLKKNHGPDSIVELRTIRLLGPIRREHNYLPMVNMENGFMKADWPEEAVFVG